MGVRHFNGYNNDSSLLDTLKYRDIYLGKWL